MDGVPGDHPHPASTWSTWWPEQSSPYGDPKSSLRSSLQDARAALLSRLDGLSEYDIRRPVTPTGTNLLGLIKHLTLTEARYLGEVFGRPFPESLPRWDEPAEANADFWVTAAESRAEVIDRYRRACAHGDATLDALALDAPGVVPWWTWSSDVVLFNVVVHLLVETCRHAGHADIVREQLDAATGLAPDAAAWSAHRARVDAAARQAGT